MTTQISSLDYRDSIETEITEYGRSYQSIQMETFESLGTIPTDWGVCEIKDVFYNDDGTTEIIFVFPDGYTQIQHNRFKETFSSRCQLCGHGIKRLFFIKCDRLKLILQVGSECVNTYHGAHFTTKMIRTFKDNKTRETYRDWSPKALSEIEKHRLGNTKPDAYNPNWIPYDLYKLRQKIKGTDSLKTTSRKLENLMKKGNKLLFETGVSP